MSSIWIFSSTNPTSSASFLHLLLSFFVFRSISKFFSFFSFLFSLSDYLVHNTDNHAFFSKIHVSVCTYPLPHIPSKSIYRQNAMRVGFNWVLTFFFFIADSIKFNYFRLNKVFIFSILNLKQWTTWFDLNQNKIF